MLEQILSILSDGEFHSGDELGEILGVSRTAVWKRLKKIEELGLSLHSIKGRGYRIEGGLDLLSAARVEAVLDSKVKNLISELELLPVVTSTNQLALEKASVGGCGYVCSAEQQVSGRGRRGRTWISPYAANVYMSVVWGFATGASALGGLSLAVGVAVVDALAKAGVNNVQLKWPNDILINNQKLSGVLLEMVGDADGPCRVVVGVGVNVSMPKSAGNQIDQPWVDLKSRGAIDIKRSELLALLLNEVLPLLASYETVGFGHYRDRWQSLDAYRGREVFVRQGENIEYGVAAGVDESGALLVDSVSGRRLYHGGEVSLRGAV